MHSPLQPETHFYRLKIVDLNEEYTYTNIDILQYQKNTNDIAVYPNPNSDGWFYLETKQAQTDHLYITITNMQGQLLNSFEIKEPKAEEKHIFHLPFPSGPYLMNMIPDNGQPVQKRLVVIAE